MPPRIRKSTASKTTPPPVDVVMHSILDKMETVPIRGLKPHPKNPRQGNVRSVAKSLEANGQFKPIVVQRSTMHICAGNHTWLAARSLGWTHINAVLVDVDDEAAMRILLADNKTSDDSTYDDAILNEILNSMAATTAGLEGTGFSTADLDELVASVGKVARDTLDSADLQEREHQKTVEALRRSKTFDGSPLGEEGDPDDDEEAGEYTGGRKGSVLNRKEDDGPDMRDAEEKLPGMLQFKPPTEMEFETIGFWGISKLRNDMLMEFDELPEKLETWAGSATKDWPDDETWWLYNYGVDSTSGMKDISKMILGFYTHDEYFENWWNYPERFAAKLMNSGVKYAIAPNYSQWPTDPHVLNLWNLHRSRWVARYLQEAGIKVIPDVNWPLGDEKFLKDYVLATLPKGLPMIAMQLQTFDPKNIDLKDLARLYQLVFDTLKPEGLLFYAGEPGQEFLAKNVETNCPVRMLDTRVRKLSEKNKGKKKKLTL